MFTVKIFTDTDEIIIKILILTSKESLIDLKSNKTYFLLTINVQYEEFLWLTIVKILKDLKLYEVGPLTTQCIDSTTFKWNDNNYTFSLHIDAPIINCS